MESGEGLDTLESSLYGGMVTEIFLPTEVTFVDDEGEALVITGGAGIGPTPEAGGSCTTPFSDRGGGSSEKLVDLIVQNVNEGQNIINY